MYFNNLITDDPDWTKASDLVLNKRVGKTPGATIYATTEQDVAVVVNFTQHYNMNLKIISSGNMCNETIQCASNCALTCMELCHLVIKQCIPSPRNKF